MKAEIQDSTIMFLLVELDRDGNVSTEWHYKGIAGEAATLLAVGMLEYAKNAAMSPVPEES